MNPSTESDARKDPDRLEREIDQQRSEINETLRALEDKFSSREIAGQFMHYFGGPGREWMDSLGTQLKSNPLPTLLTGIGLAWLMMGDRSGARRAYAYGDYDYEYEGRGKFGEAASKARSALYSVRQKASEMGDRVAQAGEALHDKAAHAGEALHDRAAQAGEALHDRAAHAGETMRYRAAGTREGLDYRAMTARDNFEHMAREQPLALGAIGIALGALIGAALPRTEQEKRMLGRASERIREKGKEMAREGYEQASRKVTEVAAKAEDALTQATAQTGSPQDSATTQQAQQPRAGTSPPF